MALADEVMLWIPLTIMAAFLQNLRSAMQKAIKGRLSTTGAAYARFVYALPLAVIYVLGLGQAGFAMPLVNVEFLIYCALGGASQILFTVVLLWMFNFRSFAVGTTFSKLEVVLIAGLGAVLLGDTVGPIGLFAIAVGAMGTMLIAMTEARLTPGALLRGMTQKVTLVGLLCAALLGASSVFYRGAVLALDGPDFVVKAAFALMIALTMQTVMMGVWFIAFDREELVRVARNWRQAAPVGVVGMACSVCWFTAFTLQNAAYVRALGQVELLFTFLVTVFFFKEKVTKGQVAGIVLIVSAILLLLLGEVA